MKVSKLYFSSSKLEHSPFTLTFTATPAKLKCKARGKGELNHPKVIWKQTKLMANYTCTPASLVKRWFELVQRGCPNSFEHTTTSVYLAIYDCCRQRLLSLLATHVLASITSSEGRRRDSVSAHAQFCVEY